MGTWNIKRFCLNKNGKSKPETLGKTPVYGGNGIIEFVNQFNYSCINIIDVLVHTAVLFYYNENDVGKDNALAGISNNHTLYFDYLLLKQLNLNSISEGSSHPLLTQGILNSIELIKSNNIEVYQKFEEIIKPNFRLINNLKEQTQILTEFQSLLLSRLAVGKEMSV
ncbi:MAG: hypothetical protein LC112_06250 [Flavobacteriales bacterium]|nr:hypothetical protein [Flavobacteriales bacterium]